ncbi:MAG TPA: trypsin [Campylobacterales bacterium]|nr:trypsin [Campylobacterales bacterium]
MTEGRLRILLPLSFFIFIGFIIYLADTADHNFAFRLIGHIPYGDKLMHGLLYGIMALLLNYGLKFKAYKFLGFNMQLGAIIVLVFATIEEISQYWIPSRTFDLGDLLADFVGVVLFSLIKWGKR